VNINEVFNILNFWIAKERGSYYTIPELEEITHIGQLAFYNDMKAKYSTSTLIKEILSPFKRKYDFTPTNTISGYIVIPSNVGYLDLLDIQITYTISNRTIYVPVPVVNEDERSDRLRSQVDPVTVTSPLAEMDIPRFIRLYPQGTGYTGTVTYFTEPVKPVFAYTLISGRVIVYDDANSTQLAWRPTEITKVILKSLESIGINLLSEQVAQFSVAKTTDNYLGNNHL
jgi:hypothetical protein